eukprot:PITA_26020
MAPLVPDEFDSSSSSSDGGEEIVSFGGHETQAWRSRKRTYGLVSQEVGSLHRGSRKRLLDENLSLLRSLTNSCAIRKNCIILDALKYIEELKRRVNELNRDLVAELEVQPGENAGRGDLDIDSVPALPTHQVTVANEERTRGLQIHVACQKWPGLLVAILEAVEVLGLNVLQARVSCKDYFMFDALSGEDKQGRTMDPNLVKATLLQVIDKMNPENGACSPSSDVTE